MMGGSTEDNTNEMAMLWVLNLSDGEHSLLEIAERAQLSFDSIYNAVAALEEHGLLKDSLKGSPSNRIEERV
jgi:aminopeptidase-like protein